MSHPEQVLIGLEISDFAGKVNEEDFVRPVLASSVPAHDLIEEIVNLPLSRNNSVVT
jgi:hypothetical protein